MSRENVDGLVLDDPVDLRVGQGRAQGMERGQHAYYVANCAEADDQNSWDAVNHSDESLGAGTGGMETCAK